MIKGASSYIGACHLHYVGFYIQDHYHKKKYQKMIDYYPSLVESAIEYKKYSKEILAKYKNKKYVHKATDDKVAHSN